MRAVTSSRDSLKTDRGGPKGWSPVPPRSPQPKKGDAFRHSLPDHPHLFMSGDPQSPALSAGRDRAAPHRRVYNIRPVPLAQKLRTPLGDPCRLKPCTRNLTSTASGASGGASSSSTTNPRPPHPASAPAATPSPPASSASKPPNTASPEPGTHPGPIAKRATPTKAWQLPGWLSNRKDKPQCRSTT